MFHIAEFVTIRIGQADVDNLGAVFDLRPPDVGSLFKLAAFDQLAEFSRADDIGAFAHQNGAVVVFGQ